MKVKNILPVTSRDQHNGPLLIYECAIWNANYRGVGALLLLIRGLVGGW